MNRPKLCLFIFSLLTLSTLSFSHAEDAPKPPDAKPVEFTRIEDVVYGRKFGMALTLDVIKPKENANGLGIIYVMSGGWVSSHDWVAGTASGLGQAYLKRGYTIFAVCHGCQPKYTIPEVVKDMTRAVRFIRLHAKEYGVDPEKLGITGSSAGGHLSCMMGTNTDTGDPKSKDPVEQMSSRVACVACFYPPTDFFNYGKEGENAVGKGTLKDYAAPFDFKDFDKEKKVFERITDEAKINEIVKSISPAWRVTKDSAPTLIAHGDVDKLVPIQQAEVFLAKLKDAGVDGKLITHKDGSHGWKDQKVEAEQFADWFDAHLKVAPVAATAPATPVQEKVAEPVAK